MAIPTVRKHSRERVRKRGEGDIYSVIDDLIAPSFVASIAARSAQVEMKTTGSVGNAKGKKLQ